MEEKNCSINASVFSQLPLVMGACRQQLHRKAGWGEARHRLMGRPGLLLAALLVCAAPRRSAASAQSVIPVLCDEGCP